MVDFDDERKYNLMYTDNPRAKAEKLEGEVKRYASMVVDLISNPSFDPFLTDYRADSLIKAFLRAHGPQVLAPGSHFLPVRKRAQYVGSGDLLEELELRQARDARDAVAIINGEWNHLFMSQTRRPLAVEILIHGGLKKDPGERPHWLPVTPVELPAQLQLQDKSKI